MNFLRKYVPIAVIVTVFSELFFYPTASTIRISLGILILHLILLVRDRLNPIYTALLCGLVVLIERITFQSFATPYTLADVLANNLPSLVYYISYGVLFKGLKLRSYKQDFFKLLVLLATVDIASNLAEAVTRGQITTDLLKVIVLSGGMRSILAYFIYTLWQRHELYILKIEHQERYNQLHTLVANIESELFYLRKSTREIEKVMGKSYTLFEEAPEGSLQKDAALDIAKDIHEIKKDYLRVISGFEDMVTSFETLDELRLSEIFQIMKTNYKKVIGHTGKDIQLLFEYAYDPVFKDYTKLFTLINNLVDNSIAACRSGDRIHISYESKDQQHIFRVIDTGSGMDPETQNWIFEPGYTTKYDSNSGKPSTGIGLNHVQNVVDYYGGTISVESIKDTGTKFTIVLPMIKNHVQEVRE